MKAKSRDTGWNADSSIAGFGAGRSLLGVGNAFQDDLEGDDRAIGAELFQDSRMQFAERAEHILRADLNHARASRMQPVRAARYHLQGTDRRAGGC